MPPRVFPPLNVADTWGWDTPNHTSFQGEGHGSHKEVGRYRNPLSRGDECTDEKKASFTDDLRDPSWLLLLSLLPLLLSLLLLLLLLHGCPTK